MMTRETQDLLEAFEQLSAEEKRNFCLEILRRYVDVSFRFHPAKPSATEPFDSGPLSDEEIGLASAALFAHLDEY